jgi:hypothetical protein
MARDFLTRVRAGGQEVPWFKTILPEEPVLSSQKTPQQSETSNRAAESEVAIESASRRDARSQGIASGIVASNRPGLPRPGSFLNLGTWEGHVVDVKDDSFTARLDDLMTGTHDQAEFFVSDLSNFDRSLLAPGAVFYWTIGYKVAPGGQRSRDSQIRFRRLPKWSHREIERIRKEAAERIANFSDYSGTEPERH